MTLISRIIARGFSLVELLVYMTIFSVLAAGLYSGFNYFTEVKIEVSQTADLQQKSAQSFDALRRSLGSADKVKLSVANDPRGQVSCATLENLYGGTRRGLEFPIASNSKALKVNSWTGVLGSASRTFSFWMRPQDVTSKRTILGYGGPNNISNRGRMFEIYYDHTNGIGIDVSHFEMQGSRLIEPFQWTHVAVVYDNSTYWPDNVSFDDVSASLYVNGQEVALGLPAQPVVDLNTISGELLNVGGSVSNNRFGSSNEFRGHLANLRVWERALTRNEILSEMTTTIANDNDGLIMDFPLTQNLTDAQPDNYTMSTTAFPTVAFEEYVDEYYRQSVYAFAKAPGSNLYKLYQTQGALNRDVPCQHPLDGAQNLKAGWTEFAGDDLWEKHPSNASALFAYEDVDNRSVRVNARLGFELNDKVISTDASSLILTGNQGRDRDLCRIAPNLVGFNTGGDDITEIVISIEQATFEKGNDFLYFFDADEAIDLTEQVGSQTAKYTRYTNIKDDASAKTNSEIWPKLTAKYYPATGLLKLYTRSSASNLNSAPSNTMKSLEEWERVLRQVSFKTSSETYRDEKEFLFSLGPNIPCKINNWVACRNIDNDDGDNDPSTCYHWFNFRKYTDLEAADSAFSCWDRHDWGTSNREECRSDWENARHESGEPVNKLFGLEGYLATIVSADETVCALEKITGSVGWLGASDRRCERNESCGDVTSNGTAWTSSTPYGGPSSLDANGESYWYWVTGPEGEFSQATDPTIYFDQLGASNNSMNAWRSGYYIGQNSGSSNHTEAVTVGGENVILPRSYRNWAGAEPNNCCDFDEDYLHTWASSKWNDYTSYWKVEGYLIEYGGMKGDPKRTLLKSTKIDTFEFLKNCQK